MTQAVRGAVSALFLAVSCAGGIPAANAAPAAKATTAPVTTPGAKATTPLTAPDAKATTPAAPDTLAYLAELRVKEFGFDGALRIRLFHLPGYLSLPPAAGHLFLVAADSASGRDAFFIPSDLTFELGSSQVYPVETEQASDPFGQLLGGKLRPGETQLGFLLVPDAVRFDRYLPAHPDSVVIRYAQFRAPLRRATAAQRKEWTTTMPRPFVAAALNAWWDWARAMNEAPDMNEGERRFFAERMFPGQGQILAEEGIPAEALRNAILRVGERRLLEGPARQRVAPRYPAVARRAGAHGLVVALCYVNDRGEVADASVLASNTVHMLNLAALSAAMEWRFPRVRGEDGAFLDGWRILPFQFRLPPPAGVDTLAPGGPGYEPPRIVKAVKARYPDKARRKRIHGTVIYRATIDARGKLVQATLVQGVHPLLDEAALEALEHTLFLPATRNGVPVRGEIDVPFPFEKKR